MFALPAFFIGFALGFWRAHKLGGNLLDKLQFGAAFGMALFLVALLGTIIADKMGLL